MTCIKISIALTLLRIQQDLWWKIFLFFIIGIQAAYGIGNTFFILLQCRPLAAAYDLSITPKQCLPPSAILIASNLGSAINITTDFSLSLAPIAFLHKLNRPLREKVLVCLLMGMGLLASISSIMKTVVVQSFADPTLDTWAIGISICTWTALEELLALLAACIPAQKPLLQRFLGYIGIDLTTKHPAYPSYYRATGPGTFHGATTSAARHKTSTKDDEEVMLDNVPHSSGKSAELASISSAPKLDE